MYGMQAKPKFAVVQIHTAVYVHVEWLQEKQTEGSVSWHSRKVIRIFRKVYIQITAPSCACVLVCPIIFFTMRQKYWMAIYLLCGKHTNSIAKFVNGSDALGMLSRRHDLWHTNCNEKRTVNTMLWHLHACCASRAVPFIMLLLIHALHSSAWSWSVHSMMMVGINGW